MALRMKSCPFCGGDAYLADTWNGQVAVKCSSCGCSTLYFKQKETAIHIWNHRSENGNKKQKSDQDLQSSELPNGVYYGK